MPSTPVAPRSAPDTPRLEALAASLNSAAIHLLRRIRLSDRAMGISPTKASALSVLVFGGPCSLTALAAAEQVTAPSMSRTVAALETAGYVRREPDPRDRRAQVLHATPEARALLESGRRLRVESLVRELSTLPTVEVATLERAMAVMQRLEAASNRSPTTATRSATR